METTILQGLYRVTNMQNLTKTVVTTTLENPCCCTHANSCKYHNLNHYPYDDQRSLLLLLPP